MYKTPIIKIENDDNDLYIKRDDLIPFSFGGNKVRIAAEFIDDMAEQGKNCIVGYGNARSNLSRALANICYQKKIPCHIISPSDEDGTRIDTFNSKMVQSFDAVFHYCSKTNVKSTVESVIEELKNKGLNPYYIYGDSNGKGNEHIPIKAYIKVYEEIKNQFDYIFLATGTGMTQGGLLAGKAKNNGREKIIGISVARSSDNEAVILRNNLIAYSDRVENIDIPEIIVVDAYLCGGYGKYDRNIEKIISIQMRQNGIPLDPVYTGKAFYGMIDLLKKNNIRGKKVLFLHTGGTPLYFDYLQGIHLSGMTDIYSITEAVTKLEDNLSPSLRQRNIDLEEYANKLYKHGKVWGHYDLGLPISIIAGYFNDEQEHTAYLSMLAVNENYRGKHLASSLLSVFEEYALETGMDRIKLEVRKNNKKAQLLYDKFGYVISGDASDSSYYMIKSLKKYGGGVTPILRFLIKVDHLFPVPLSEKKRLSELAGVFMVYGTMGMVKEGDKIISLCAGYANDNLTRLAYISVVASLPEYAGKGYGKVAVRDFITKALNNGMKAIHLYAVKDNAPAIRMYESLGFIDYIVEDEPRPEDRHLILYL